MDLFKKHEQRFTAARKACKERFHWSPFPEAATLMPDHEARSAQADQEFTGLCNQPFNLSQPGIIDQVGDEISPYTREPLGIHYPRCEPDALFSAAEAALPAWARLCPEQRIGLLMDVIDALESKVFLMARAVMHTAGQSPNMSFTGSGVNALDRAIEALVYAYEAMRFTPDTAHWERQFGKATISLDKTYRLVPRGVAVCFTCASFPTWNAWPSMMASLATGNPVIVKPHPGSVLPMAISVECFREVLAANGQDPNLVTLQLDTRNAPLGKILVKHPKTAIVDFTGSARFGSWVEQNAHPALCFTETAGVNTVVLDSCRDLDAVIRSLATTLCMFSAQMCTSPQNIYLPKQGVKEGDNWVPASEVRQRLADAVHAIADNPRKAAMILATIQSPETESLLDDLAGQAEVLLPSNAYPHPDYPNARTRTPLMLSVCTAQRDLYLGERFGPVSFVIECESAEDALQQATRDVREAGGLTAFLYSENERFIEQAELAYARAGAQLTINLTGPMPLNFAAAYSDFHVTGLNPAGNASLTELGFVAQRFRISQSRRPSGGC
ncbi:phenylacetic acid degradation protein paaN [Litorivivens lipolytica]|uniref:Phenylacetic acid degradation protein paaN n=1 Tax=Litorivivens lipolytica TaxID=1524264 RepID=A0A7W4W467_9GAMM|nr:aldehyde dehydrogenase family protein [Litorivivens lipolytica]MBB3047010.1 phenylacetic acid degradation protein paaN [Litorivivens lipolytica]